VHAADLTPVHVDIDRATYCISPSAAAAAVTPRTAALVAVHFAGQPAGLDRLARIAGRSGIALIEDACLAPGAAFQGRTVGSLGRAAVFSFGVRKPVSAGEGGIVTTSDPSLAAALRRLRSFGADADGEIWQPSGNYRLTELQAAAVLPQLARLEEDRKARADAARLISEQLAPLPVLRPLELDPGVTRHGWGQLWMRYHEELAGVSRQRFVEAVHAEGIPLFPGWGRVNYTLGFYQAPRAAAWLEARASGREPEHYERTVCPHAEHAAFTEALLLDFPILDADHAVAQDAAEALTKVASNLEALH
jgi:dTDP-4-amino-4,6-dideoxygalactose transaminase